MITLNIPASMNNFLLATDLLRHQNQRMETLTAVSHWTLLMVIFTECV